MSETTVSARRASVPKPWEERQDRAERQWAAEAVWEALDEPRRAAVLTAVGEKMGELQQSVKAWVPEALDLRPSSSGGGVQILAIELEIAMPVITDREAEQMTAEERERALVLAELAAIAAKLRRP